MKELIECHEYDAHYELYKNRIPIVFSIEGRIWSTKLKKYKMPLTKRELTFEEFALDIDKYTMRHTKQVL